MGLRFVRRSVLQEGEYRTNFRQIDRDAIALLKSAEARQVTHLMAAVYLALIDAPAEYWEREGVLRFAGGESGGRLATAWRQLVGLLGCGNTTAKKALDWMHARGLIGYYAGKNGAGIRVFINRAASSIGRRAGQKNLRLVGAPTEGSGTPAAGAPFSDSYAGLEVVETGLNRRAPQTGAGTKPANEPASVPARQQTAAACVRPGSEGRETAAAGAAVGAMPVEEVVRRLKAELEPCVREAAGRAAAQTAAQEAERTRHWFETKALPKAARVAQRETYDLLRRLGGVRAGHGAVGTGSEVGRSIVNLTAERPLTPKEVRETAEVCLALLETQGKSIEVTLSEISSESGGWLLPSDAVRVREEARELALSYGREGKT